MNQNTEYERFTQEIYQSLLNAQGINTIDVKHNIKLTGKSGQQHQIDVYWEYKINGFLYKVVIECKNYNRSVSVDRVNAFYGVLSDLVDVQGIMITKTGYQSGAKKIADYYGINLKELRAPNKDDDCRIGILSLNLGMTLTQQLFMIDNDWAKANNINWKAYRNYMNSLTQRGHKWGEEYLPLDTIGEVILDTEGEVITTLNKLQDKRPQATEYIYSFENAYINTRHLGKVKIRAIKYLTSDESKTKTISFDARDIVKAILKDALNGEILFFMKDHIG